VILGGEKATLDRQLTHGNLQNLIVRDFFHHRRRWMFMAMAPTQLAAYQRIYEQFC
jgi:hypothetical protein